MVRKIGNNEKCPCGSGHKYKKCCAKILPGLEVASSPKTIRLTATQMVICLLRQLGGTAVVELEEVVNIGDTCIDMEREGDSMHLSVIESEEQGVILTPPENSTLILRS